MGINRTIGQIKTVGRSKRVFLVGSLPDKQHSQAFENTVEMVARAIIEGEYDVIVNFLPGTKMKDQREGVHLGYTFDEKVLIRIDELISGKKKIKDDRQKDDSEKDTSEPVFPEVDKADKKYLGKSVKVLFYESANYNPFQPTDFEKITIERRNIGGSKQKVIMRSIQDADCALLLGGKSTVELTGQLTTILEERMLPLPYIPSTSGESLWREYYSYYGNKMATFIDAARTKIEALDSKKTGYKEEIDVLAKGFYDRLEDFMLHPSPFTIRTRQSRRDALWQLVLTLICFAGWFVLYSFGGKLTDPLCISLIAFSSIPISVFLGTVLRNGTFEKGRLFMIDLSRSLVVAFGLVLIYLYASFLSSGHVPKVNQESFARVAINLSILGLFSGLLLESANKMLKERLQSFAKKNTVYTGTDEDREN